MRTTLFLLCLATFARACTPASFPDDDSSEQDEPVAWITVSNGTAYLLDTVQSGPCDEGSTTSAGAVEPGTTVTWSVSPGCTDVLVVDVDSWWALATVDLDASDQWTWLVESQDMQEPLWWD